jgi:uncharacterized protein (TIGR02217 family)
MGFHEVRFPVDISYGSRGGPGYRTGVVQLDSGAETRFSRWATARRKYDVSYGVKTMTQLAALTSFYMARMGAANSFRYKDFADCTSHSSHHHLTESGITAADQLLGVGNGVKTDFQLLKRYEPGPYERVRNITKPVSGTVRVALAGVEQVSGWVVDLTTGIVTFSTAPGAGVEVRAGFQFDVPVRFDESADDAMQASIDDFNSGAMQSLMLIEVLDEHAVEDAFFYGGANEQAISSTYLLSILNGRVQVFEAEVDNVRVRLPEAEGLPLGGPLFWIVNAGSSNTILLSEGEVTLVSIEPGEVVTVLLTEDAGGTRHWVVFG